MSAQRRKRDRYQSGFDAAVPGVRSATYDIGLALYILEEIAKKHGLLGGRHTFYNGQSWTAAEALEIARRALNLSISPAIGAYQRLQQNEEAARLIVDADMLGDSWRHVSGALTDTLNNHAIVSRGFVSGSRRIIERRAKEADKENGGDAA